MKYLSLCLIFLSTLFFSPYLYSKADLTVTAFGFDRDAVNRGGYIVATAVVQNVGTSTSFNVKTSFHLYQSGDLLTNENRRGYVSLHELDPMESDTLFFLMSIPESTINGFYKVGIWVDNFNEETELDEHNNAYFGLSPNSDFLYIEPSFEQNIKTTYPIIFIHGLGGNDKTWYEATRQMEDNYGFVSGGVFDYCLDPDGDVSTSDYNSYFSDYTNGQFLTKGDFYYVNFDVSNNGYIYPDNSNIKNRSNQSAIAKQGWALSSIIAKVLALTGKDKVVLIGHSMGGLCAREYIQNPEKWQEDGRHHIAKLHTTDTPHGGSNDGSWLLDLFQMYDNRSEALRDLRYDDAFTIGTYLDGGYESDIMFDYHNSDVNCNGTLDHVVGLNEKFVQNDLSYSCSIAMQWDAIYDVVDDWSADINGYLAVQPPANKPTAPVFYVDKDHRHIHNDIPGLLNGLDQQPGIAYELEIGTLSMEFITEQGDNMSVADDCDSYSFTIESDGEFELSLLNLSSPQTGLLILDEFDEFVGGISSSAEDFKTTKVNLKKGTYQILIISTLEHDPTILNQSASPYYIATSFKPFELLVSEFNTDVQQGCASLIVNYSNESSGLYDHQEWFFQGGIPEYSDERNPRVEYPTSGIFETTLIVGNGIQSDTVNVKNYIIVEDFADPEFDFQLIGNSRVEFSVANPDSAVEYIWDLGDDNTAEGIAITHDYELSGEYTVKLQAINECGTSSSETTIITTPTDVPIVVEIKADISEGCNPLEVAYSLNIEGNASEFEWNFEGGTPSSSRLENPVITYNSEGTFTTDVVVNNSTYSGVASFAPVVVFDTPILDFEVENTSANEISLTVVDPDLNLIYSWDFGDNNTGLGPEVVHTYAEIGAFKITLTSENDCGFSKMEQDVVIGSTSTSDQETPSFKIYPNPSRGLFKLDLNRSMHIEQIDVTAANGVKVGCTIIVNSERGFSIDCSHLASGIYYVRIRTGSSIHVEPLYKVD